MTLKIKLKELNNKSRKGLYFYIKQKGKKGAYYKYKEGQTIDPYKQYYTDKYVKDKPKGKIKDYIETYNKKIAKQKTTITPISRQADRYLKRIRKQTPIQQIIKKGISTAVIPNALKTGKITLEKTKQDLLRRLVLDNDLLKVVATTENIKKIKTRLEYRINILNPKGETLATTSTFNKIPETVINELQNSIVIGETIKKLETPKIENKLKNIGYKGFTRHKDGQVNSIRIQIIFRKGKWKYKTNTKKTTNRKHK